MNHPIRRMIRRVPERIASRSGWQAFWKSELDITLCICVRTSRRSSRGPRQVEAVEVHDLMPGGDEVVDELLAGIGAGVDFGQGAEHGV